MKFSATVEEFAAQRRAVLDEAADLLREILPDALTEMRAGEEDWWDPLMLRVRAIWDTVLADEGVDPTLADFAPTRILMEETMPRTTDDPNRDAQVERLALWLSVLAVNSASDQAAEVTQREDGDLVLREWVTMQDEEVRDTHRPLNGTQRPVGEPFTVGGVDTPYPGAPVGPPDLWLGCRCVLRPTLEAEQMSSKTTFAIGFEEDLDEDLVDAPMIESDADMGFDRVPVHGVLAPINVESGDGRTLSALTWAEVPLPLRWVKQDVGLHHNAVRVGTITNIYESDGMIRWSGHMLSTPEADEAVNILAEGSMGLSVDLDSTSMEVLDDSIQAMEEGEMPSMNISGRVRAATLVDISAFVEAYAMLGTEPEDEIAISDDDELIASGCAPCVAKELDEHYATMVEFAISEAEWDGSSGRFTDDEWFRSTVVHTNGDSRVKSDNKVPILEPNGDMNRAAVHNAAARINQTEASPEAIRSGKRALIAAYRRLEEEPPESLTASAFAPGTKDGPGWLTNPVDTQRLRNYWTRGAGAAKIRWGAPGDFNRCRTQLRKYIANPQWLAGTCANLHKVALGVWPGQHAARTVEGAIMASAFTIYEETNVLPADWFMDPELDKPTPVTVLPDGRTFGHIAVWGTCHTGLGLSVGMDDSCTAAPGSPSNYAYFRTGIVDTDQGEIPVGNLTMGIGHAPDRASAKATMAHYDNVDAVVADVVTGEDAHGIWFSGAMRGDLTDDQVRAFKASTLSGDWRTIGEGLELVAALAVNVPGFPIPRLALAASGGRQTSLIAAGMVQRETKGRTMKIDLEFDKAQVNALVDSITTEMSRRERVRSAKVKYLSSERQRLAGRS